MFGPNFCPSGTIGPSVRAARRERARRSYAPDGSDKIDRKADTVRQTKRVRPALVASLGLVAGSLAVVAGTVAPAQAADPDVTINLVGINDFHGRIDANTVKWAGTVEQLSEAGARRRPALLVGAGDLIGASLFASAVPDDQPTIDVMNDARPRRLGRRQPRVRQGLADLRDRVIGAGGTPQRHVGLPRRERLQPRAPPTRSLPEYATFTVDGVDGRRDRRGHRGDPSLVSPGGIADLDFGDPVDAVNRVAGPAQRRQRRQRRGRRDRRHVPRRASRRHARATRAEVAERRRVRQDGRTSTRAVDAIFNGHTHQAYALDAPVPGGDRPTRPIVQTGAVRRQRRPDQADRRHRHRQGHDVHGRATSRGSRPADADLIAQYPGSAGGQEDRRRGAGQRQGRRRPAGRQDHRRHHHGVQGRRLHRRDVRRRRARRPRQGVDAGRPGGQRAARRHPGRAGQGRHRHRQPGWPAGRAAVRRRHRRPTRPTPTAWSPTPRRTRAAVRQQHLAGPADRCPAQGRARAAVAAGGTPTRPYLHLGLSDNVRVTQDAEQARSASGSPRCSINGVKPLDPAKTYTVTHVLVPRPRAATTSPPSRRARPRTPVWSTATCGSTT